MQGNNIYLRDVISSDASIIFLWENLKEYRQYGNNNQRFSLVEIADFIESSKDVITNKQLRFMVCMAKSDRIIGIIDLYDINFIHEEASIGILIGDKKFRNKGYGIESIQLLEKYAFKNLAIKRIRSFINKENWKSIKLFKKVGYQEVSDSSVKAPQNVIILEHQLERK